MRPRVQLWCIDGKGLTQLEECTFAQAHKEKDLESWVENDTSLLGPNRELKVIGRQVPIEGAGLLDLLAVDEEEGRLVIVEFKRQLTTRDAIARSWITLPQFAG